MPSEVEAQSSNHWTAGEFHPTPFFFFFNFMLIELSKQEVTSTLDLLVRHLHVGG